MPARITKDKIIGTTVRIIATFSALILIFIFIGLLYKSLPILKSHSLGELLFSSAWKPLKGQFGFWPFIISTIYVTVVALIIAIPLCLLCAIYLAEYANKRFKQFILPLIDILAGI